MTVDGGHAVALRERGGEDPRRDGVATTLEQPGVPVPIAIRGEHVEVTGPDRGPAPYAGEEGPPRPEHDRRGREQLRPHRRGGRGSGRAADGKWRAHLENDGDGQRETAIQKRRVDVGQFGLGPVSAVTVTGSRAIPQIGHDPGRSRDLGMHRAGPTPRPHPALARSRRGCRLGRRRRLGTYGRVPPEPVVAPLGAEVVCRAVVIPRGQGAGLAVDVSIPQRTGRSRPVGWARCVVWGELGVRAACPGCPDVALRMPLKMQGPGSCGSASAGG